MTKLPETRGVLTPDEFSQAKRRLLDGTAPPAMGGDAAAVVNRFRRSRSAVTNGSTLHEDDGVMTIFTRGSGSKP